MTPKEKANELISINMELFGRHDRCVADIPNIEVGYKHALECAMNLVNEILSLRNTYSMGRDEKYSEGEFWEEVKKEIQKLNGGGNFNNYK